MPDRLVDNNTPLVSIITPSLNQAAFIDQTIRSVLAQDYPRLEYIVIDGGSTDGSTEIIEQHQRHLAHWISEPDLGQADAINKGMARARGQILGWLNSDDLYFPETVRTAVALFKKHPEAVLIYGNAVIIDEEAQFLRYFTEIEPPNFFRLRNCADFIMQPSTFFRRSAFKQAGPLDRSLHWCMDWDLWCRLSAIGRVHYEPVLLAANRQHVSAKTQTGGRPRLTEIRKIRDRHGTSWWPHAHFSYLAKEMRRRGKSSVLRRLMWHTGATMATAGGFRNFLHARRNRRPIGGLYHGTHRCLPHVHIRFPLFRDARTVELDLCANGDQIAGVRINGHNRPFPIQYQTEVKLLFDLPRSAKLDQAIDLQIKFRSMSGRINAHLNGVRLQ